MKTLTSEEISEQILNLVRFIRTNPAVNFTILSSDILTPRGDTVAHFNNHLQALKAISSIREQLGT